MMLILPRNTLRAFRIQALACCAGACLQSLFQHLGKIQPAKWGIFNRRKLGNIQPALTYSKGHFDYSTRVAWHCGVLRQTIGVAATSMSKCREEEQKTAHGRIVHRHG